MGDLDDPRDLPEVEAIQPRITPEIGERLRHYVYLLFEPGEKQPFYIGKGQGGRIMAHVGEALSTLRNTEKLDTIRRIHRAGKEVEMEILRHGMSEPESIEVEAAVIDLFPTATNAQKGNYADRGREPLNELVARYRSEPARLEGTACRWLLVNINRKWKRGMKRQELYDAARSSWSCSLGKYSITHVAAVAHGIIREVYRVKSVTFDGYDSHKVKSDPQKIIKKQRWSFEGEPEKSDRGLAALVGKRVNSWDKRGASNPVAFVNPMKRPRSEWLEPVEGKKYSSSSTER